MKPFFLIIDEAKCWGKFPNIHQWQPVIRLDKNQGIKRLAVRRSIKTVDSGVGLLAKISSKICSEGALRVSRW